MKKKVFGFWCACHWRVHRVVECLVHEFAINVA